MDEVTSRGDPNDEPEEKWRGGGGRLAESTVGTKMLALGKVWCVRRTKRQPARLEWRGAGHAGGRGWGGNAS